MYPLWIRQYQVQNLEDYMFYSSPKLIEYHQEESKYYVARNFIDGNKIILLKYALSITIKIIVGTTKSCSSQIHFACILT